jgi:hypothetical protein
MNATGQIIPRALLLLVLATGAGCVTHRHLADIQPGMAMDQVRERFGSPDKRFVPPFRPGTPEEVTWYYDAYRSKRIFEWQTIPTTQRPGWRLEPGYTTIGVPYRRFEIIFHDGLVVGRAEFEPPPEW